MKRFVLALALVVPIAKASSIEDICGYYASEALEVMGWRQHGVSAREALKFAGTDNVKQAMVKDAYLLPIQTDIDLKLVSLFKFYDSTFDTCMQVLTARYGDGDED